MSTTSKERSNVQIIDAGCMKLMIWFSITCNFYNLKGFSSSHSILSQLLLRGWCDSWFDTEKMEPLYRAGGMEISTALMKKKKKEYWLLQTLKIELSHNPAIPLLGIYSKEMKSPSYKGICTPGFTAAFFTISKVWKQSKCPLMDD